MTSEDFQLGDTYEKPLLPDHYGDPMPDVLYDETGALSLAAKPQVGRPHITAIGCTQVCSLGVLDGSWSITIKPKSQLLLGSLRGPMRIEATDDVLRISGDAYFKRAKFEPSPFDVAEGDDSPFRTGGFVRYWNLNWYPHYPFKEYVWYFRSTGASYEDGELFFPFTRHLWDKTSEEFVSTDDGWMRFDCSTQLLTSRWYPRPTVRMTGEAMIGGKRHTVTATKTSPYYRGCVVEVDVMTDRSWPGSPGGQSLSGTFRGDGLDVRMFVNETNIPEDVSLTDAECNLLMTSHRGISSVGHTWRIWTLVGSKRSGSNTFGLIFDTSGTVQREGCVSYTDATFNNSASLEPDVRGERLGDVAAGHLRTLVHEVGHCLNLFHPKSDDHNPPIGETIMNQTGDVVGFAAAGNLYPNNAQFGFNDHNRTSLIHSPDPQVAPGWKPFGWGHNSPGLGVPEPADIVGLRDAAVDSSGLGLTLQMDPSATVGEFVTAKVSLTNHGNDPVVVNSALSLAEGNLELIVRAPDGGEVIARDVVHLCGADRTTDLAAGATIESVIQLFYTNCGHTFKTAGRYGVAAVYSPVACSPERIRSATHHLVIESPATTADQKLADLTMDDGVGLSFAFGDFGTDEAAAAKLKEVSADYTETDTGTAAALVLANSYARSFRDLREGEVVRRSNAREVTTAIGRAMRDTRADRVAEIAITVASASDTEAPVLARVRDHIESKKKVAGGRAAAKRAMDLLEDHAGD